MTTRLQPNPRCAHLPAGVPAYGTHNVAGETWALCGPCWLRSRRWQKFVTALIQVNGISHPVRGQSE